MNTIRMTDEIPVAYDTDLLVVGGGPAGTCAAFSAARMGVDVMLVEQFNCLGGVATAGGHGHMCQYSSWKNPRERVVGGVPWEIVERITERRVGVTDVSNVDFEVEGLKTVLDEMAEETGVRVLYYTFFSDVVMDGDRVTHAVVQNKDGRQAIRVKQIVDCTGDGDVAWRVGCDFSVGDPARGHVQPMTLMFIIGGVDYERVKKFRNEELPARFPDMEQLWQMTGLWEEAQAAGDMRPYQKVTMGWWHTPTRPDQLGVNFTHINYVDSTKAADLTKATIEGRKQVYETIEVYKKYVPGMENIYLVSTPNTVGIRESRRILCDYTLTRDDVVNEAKFDDSIGYGSFYIDIHNIEGAGMDKNTYYPPVGFKYQIPWRILRPRRIANLQVAGRCAGADHQALGSLRVMPQCQLMGNAAGVAAALSLKAGSEYRDVDVAMLRSTLQEQNCIVDEDDVVKVG
jgi:hypothetical protein